MSRRELERLDGGKQLLALRRRNETSRRGFTESIVDYGLKDLPFIGDVVGTVVPISKMRQVANTFKKLEAGEEVDPQDLVYAQLFLDDQERMANATTGGMIGDIVRAMPGFMAEMGAYTWAYGLAGMKVGSFVPGKGTATGGIVGAAIGLAKAPAKILGGKMAKRKAIKAAGDFLTKTGGRSYARQIGKGLAMAAVEGPKLFLMDTVVNAAFNTMAGVDTFNTREAEERYIGSVLAGDEMTIQKAQAMALGSRAIEYFIERTGPMWDSVLFPTTAAQRTAAAAKGSAAAAAVRQAGMSDVLAGRITQKALEAKAKVAQEIAGKEEGLFLLSRAIKKFYQGAQPEITQKTVREGAKKGLDIKSKLMAAATATHTDKFLRNIYSNPDAIMRKLKHVGYDGIAQEMLEERLGGFLRGLTGVQGDSKGLANAFRQAWPDPQQFIAELVSFSVPMGVLAAGHRAHIAIEGNNPLRVSHLISTLTEASTPVANIQYEVDAGTQTVKPVDKHGFKLRPVKDGVDATAEFYNMVKPREVRTLPQKLAHSVIGTVESLAVGRIPQ